MKIREFNMVVYFFIIAVTVKCFGTGYTTIGAALIKDEIVDNKKNTRCVFLVDIRRTDEVATKIIASENCKPYHLIWGDPEWDAHYKDLPKDSAIILYCHSGARSALAAQFLVDNGYSKVAMIDGGIMQYPQGALVDSSYFKPWSNLPVPSYTPSTSQIVHKPMNIVITSLSKETGRAMFNLRGQRIISNIADPNAPIFILERIGTTNRKQINGLHYLVQTER